MIYALRKRLGWCPEPPTRKTEEIQGDLEGYGWSQTFSGRLLAVALPSTLALLALLIYSGELRIQISSNWAYFLLGALINLSLTPVIANITIKELKAKREAKINYKKTFFIVGLLYIVIRCMHAFMAVVFPAFLWVMVGFALPNFWPWWLSQVVWKKKNKKIVVISKGKVRIRSID